MINSAICTLFEGDYHYGVGALVNSLHRCGYRGSIEVGYRGNLPDWLRNAEGLLKGTSITLRTHLLQTDWHFANYKPKFINTVFDLNPTIQAVYYFDPDIVIKCQWFYYEEWIQNGIALVEEIATNGMPYNHPIRLRWLEVAKDLDIVCHPTFSQYFNSGFVGLHRSCKHYLADWLKIIAAVPKYGAELNSFMPANRPHPFCGVDQDALNIVAMAAEPHLSTMGPEGMDFIPGGFTMSHAVGSPKPWRKKFFLSAMKGIKPSLADKEFWNNADGPIPVFPARVVRQRRFMMNLASLIGRFYHR
jgi:hypothetical protein